MSAAEHQDDATTRLLGRVRTGGWLDAQEFPPLAYAVPGIIPEGFGLLVGPPKVGKSWALLATALAVAAGGQAFGAVPVGEPRPVLYLALEDGNRRLQDRCRILLDQDPIPDGLHYVTEMDHAADALPLMRLWLASYADQRPLVILDTLGKVAPMALPGESAYGRDYRVGDALKKLAGEVPGSTLLAAHHDRKAVSEDFVDAVSGTKGLTGSADFVIVLNRKRTEETGTMKVTGRDVSEAEYAVSMDDSGHWSLVGDSLTAAAGAALTIKATAGLGDEQTRIVHYLDEHPGSVSPGEVAAALQVAPKVAAIYLGRLARANRIQKLGRGRYAAQIQHIQLDPAAAVVSEPVVSEPVVSTPVASVVSVVSPSQSALPDDAAPTHTVVSVVSGAGSPPEYNTYNTYNKGISRGQAEESQTVMRCAPRSGKDCGRGLTTPTEQRTGECRLHLTGDARMDAAKEARAMKKSA